MRDFDFQVFLARHFETKTAIKTDRVRLRAYLGVDVPLIFRSGDQLAQQCRAYSLPAPRFKHRHASDMAVGEQAPGAHCITSG